MAFPAFSKEDGTNLTEWEEMPSLGSSDPRDIQDRIRHELGATDAQGRVVWNYVTKLHKRWAFIFQAITTTFADTLNTVASWRRGLYYPDADNTENEFRVKIQQTRLPFRQKSGKVWVQLDIEEF